jgi:hypothetical protein
MTKHLQRIEIVVKNDDMWKELQQELAKSRAISGAAIQDVTQKFLHRKEREIDTQIKAQSLQNHSRNVSPRRSSNELDYTRRSSLSYIAEKSKDIRRALSLMSGEENKKCSMRPARLNDMVNQTITKINDTMSSMGLEKTSRVSGDYKLEIEKMSIDHGTVHDWSQQDPYSGEMIELDDMTSTSTTSSSKDWTLHLSKVTLDGPLDFDNDDSFCESCYNDGELLVDFPKQSRHSKETENESNTTARMA